MNECIDHGLRPSIDTYLIFAFPSLPDSAPSSPSSDNCTPQKKKPRLHVFLMDPVLDTGGTASCAIDELLRRGVPPDHITVLNLIASPEGITLLCKKHPQVRLPTKFFSSDRLHVKDAFFRKLISGFTFGTAISAIAVAFQRTVSLLQPASTLTEAISISFLPDQVGNLKRRPEYECQWIHCSWRR